MTFEQHAVNGQGLRVYIAEAIEPVCVRLQEMVMEQDGVGLVVCEDRIERLLQRICDGRPDVLIVGTRLADANSFDTLERIGAELRLMNVVLLCDQLDGWYLVRARDLGVDYVLEAPRDIEFLSSIIHRLADSNGRTVIDKNVESYGASDDIIR